MKRLISIFLILSFGIIGCQTPSQKPLKKPKNIILMIGDGMGPGQINLLYQFLKHTKNPDHKNTRIAFERMAKRSGVAISTTEPQDKLVVDSACSATHLAIGKPSRGHFIGIDHNGNPVETILEKAQKKGLSTGLVSDTRITHATPASFASHVAMRDMENEIAEGLLETAPDVLMSGGARYFVPKGTNKKLGNSFDVKSKRKDNRDLLKEAQAKGYDLAFSRDDLNKLGSDKKILGLFASSGMANSLWQNKNKDNKDRKTPNLLEMSKVAINKLSKNEKGFFLMIEGGQIDWAAHDNDAGTLLHEMLVFNETLNYVLDWIDKNPETLLVVTADHETGGFGMGYHIRDIPKAIDIPGSKFNNMTYRPNANFGDYSDLNYLYNQKISLRNLWKEFKKLPVNDSTAKKLQNRVLEVTGINMRLKDAKAVFENEANHLHDPSHPKSKKELPKVTDYRAYNYNPDGIRHSLIARSIADKQNVVWATGGHTSTAVHLYSYGPKPATLPFFGRLNHPKVGRLLQEALGL